MAQSKAILARLSESPSTPASPEPRVNLADPAQFEQVAQKFFLTDLVSTESYAQIQHAIQARYQQDEDGELERSHCRYRPPAAQKHRA
jgi:hypothetical protein